MFWFEVWARPEPTRVAVDSSFSCGTQTRVLIYSIDTGTAVARVFGVTIIGIWNQQGWALSYYAFLCFPTCLTLLPFKSINAGATETLSAVLTGSPIETWSFFFRGLTNVWNIRVFIFQFLMLGIFWMKIRCSSAQWISQRQIFVVFSRGMLSPLNA